MYFSFFLLSLGYRNRLDATAVSREGDEYLPTSPGLVEANLSRFHQINSDYRHTIGNPGLFHAFSVPFPYLSLAFLERDSTTPNGKTDQLALQLKEIGVAKIRFQIRRQLVKNSTI